MRPPNPHSNFFSSLKQVEKRLKLEDPSKPVQETNSSSDDSLGSPLFLLSNQPTTNSTFQDNSEPPQAFLSSSPQFPSTHETPPQSSTKHHPKTVNDLEVDDVDDIQRLIELLGLSDYQEGNHIDEEEHQRIGDDNSCGCEGGFYEKIVGMKGPKCEKEVERMEGWFRYYLRNGGGGDGGGGGGGGGRSDPLRLAFLLLGKAAFVSEVGHGGFADLEFPSSIEEFLKNDPPEN